MQKNLELTEELSRIIEPEARECSRNSALALYAYLGDLPAFYVEGWAAILDGRYLIDHCWVEVDEQLVDVTLADVEPQFYFVGCRYTSDELDRIRRRSRRNVWLPLSVHHYETRHLMRVAYRQVHMTFYGVR